jgi:hypothetical protein
MPHAATDPLQGRMALFMGEISYGQLPMTMLEPPLGLPNYFLEKPTVVPDKAFVTTFYQTHAHSELLPPRLLAGNVDNHNTRYMAFLPVPFVPAFIDGMLPKDALDQLAEIMQLVPAESWGGFEYLFIFLRSACQKNTRINASSKALIPLATAGKTNEFRQW